MKRTEQIIKDLMEYKKIFRKSHFANFLGIPKSTLANWETRDSINIQKIKDAMPEISTNWLMYGEGEMLETPRTEQVEVRKPTDIDAITDVVPEEIVDAIKEAAKEEAKEELVAAVSVPIVSEDVTVASNIDLEAYLEDNGDELEKFNFAAVLEPVQVGERIKSSAMCPALNNGDVVFLRFISTDSMVSGKAYYFELKGLPRMVRIVKFEGEMLRLKAANPKYDDIVIARDRVKNVARIICSMRFNFDDIYSDLEQERKRKEAQITEMISSHTSQVDNLIKQIAKFGEREDRLIDILEKRLEM